MKPKFWFGLIVGAFIYALVFVGAPWTIPLFENTSAALVALQFVLQPVTAALVSFFLTRKGTHPLVSCLMGVAFLIIPVLILRVMPSAGGYALTTAAFILFSSAGYELNRRRTTVVKSLKKGGRAR